MGAPTAPWLFLSRWRVLPHGNRWVVVSETGVNDSGTPGGVIVYKDHEVAQRRADDLNRDEQDRIART